jgi:hypothetical protein
VLTLYRRHSPDCKHAEDRYFRRCKCPVWAEGTIEGQYLRQSTKTRSWERAEQIRRQWEENRKPTESPITITEALQAFYADRERQAVNPRTLRKYRYLKDGLLAYAAQALFPLDEMRNHRIAPQHLLKHFHKQTFKIILCWKQPPSSRSFCIGKDSN